MSFAITDLDGPFGAEVAGLDIARIDDAAFARLYDALGRHALLVFRDQAALSPEAHIAFSRRFGDLLIHPHTRFQLEGHPEILIISTVVEDGAPKGLADAGHYWHSDLSYVAEPSLGSLLHAQELPAAGGDTIFADMRAAYDALPEATKREIHGRRAVHDYAYRNDLQVAANPGVRPPLSAEARAKVPPVSHPVVRVHPDTGRLVLFVNEGFTTHVEGLEPEHSKALLALLFAHQREPAFQYRHRWRPGDLVMWDNRSLLHLATGLPPGTRRTMYRTTVAGPVPIGPSSVDQPAAFA
jgi:taurine dioxygenase